MRKRVHFRHVDTNRMCKVSINFQEIKPKTQAREVLLTNWSNAKAFVLASRKCKSRDFRFPHTWTVHFKRAQNCQSLPPIDQHLARSQHLGRHRPFVAFWELFDKHARRASFTHIGHFVHVSQCAGKTKQRTA